MVFIPTGTSKALIESARPFITTGKLLDLGCGSGIIGKYFEKTTEVFASDIDPDAVKNAKLAGLNARVSNLFDAWQGFKFDYIIDDVSGVAEDIARVSPWFNGVPCNSGKDGSDLVCSVIESAPEYLGHSGKLFFPIVSLSNVEKIRKVAHDKFKTVMKISRTEFPLPKEMLPHLDLLREHKKLGIEFTEKYGTAIWFTDIYVAEK